MASQDLLTVDRAIRSLITIAERAPTTAGEVAECLGTPLSTTYRYISSLRKHGLVWALADQTLAPGPRCVQLERAFTRTFQRSTYRAVMERVAQETGETVALLVPQNGEAICIDTVESSLPLRYTFSRGVAKSMLRGASAKAMLPWLDQEWLAGYIGASDELTPEQRERLEDELPLIRERGYATSLGEIDAGVWAVGAPVFKANGGLDASLSVIAPHFRVEGREEQIISLAVAAARELSESNYWGSDDAA